MKKRLLIPALAFALIVAGCSTPDSRIEKNSAAFSSYPPAAQAKIRAGEVDVGFTEEMVRMALGKPDRVMRRVSVEAETVVWAYADKAPVIGFGIGIGGGSRHSGGGVAIGTSTGGDRGDRVHVVFKAGRVTAIDRFGR